MHSTLIVGRMDSRCAEDVAKLFGGFDETDMPHRMGTKRRELFRYNGLYFHLQDFDGEGEYGSQRILEARTDARFIKISEDLKAYIQAYDPATWRSPADAMANRFYHWEPQQ